MPVTKKSKVEKKALPLLEVAAIQNPLVNAETQTEEVQEMDSQVTRPYWKQFCDYPYEFHYLAKQETFKAKGTIYIGKKVLKLNIDDSAAELHQAARAILYDANVPSCPYHLKWMWQELCDETQKLGQGNTYPADVILRCQYIYRECGTELVYMKWRLASINICT